MDLFLSEMKQPNSLKNKLIGDEAEERVLHLLHQKGYTVLRPDWVGIKDGQVVLFEVKAKREAYKPPPFSGHGLNSKQIAKYQSLQGLCGVRTYLVICELDSGNILGQWIDVLLQGRQHRTKHGVIIFPLESYNPHK